LKINETPMDQIEPQPCGILKRSRHVLPGAKKTLVSFTWLLYSEATVSELQRKDDRLVDSKPAPQNIQDGFLNLARREKITVTIYLVNGAKLLGRIKSFDKFSLILESGAQEQLIFKHAISTISQARRATGELRQPAAAVSESPPDPTAEAAAT
jgi:host factor-I protein